MKQRRLCALAALCALILLLVSAANAEQTVYVKSIDTSITLPDGYYPLYEGMPSNDPALSAWGLTARQAANYLKQQGALLEAQADDGTTYSLGVMEGDGTNLANLTNTQLNALVSRVQNAYAASGISMTESGLYKGQYGNLLRYTLTDGSASWLEYLYADGGQVLSLQAIPQDGKVTQTMRRSADAIAVTVWQGSGKPNARATARPADTSSLKTASFDPEGLSVGIPAGYTVYFRDALLKDSSVSADLREMIRKNGAILGLAAADDGNSEIWILARRAELYDLSAVPAADRTAALRNLTTDLSAGVLDPDGRTRGGEALSETAYDFAGSRWYYGYTHWTPGDFDEYALSTATLRKGREIAILFVRYDGEATREDTNRMNAVAQSVAFADAKPGKSRTLTDRETGARFALPDGYAQEDKAFVPAQAGGLSFVYATADVSGQEPGVDPAALDTTYYSKRDMASLYSAGIGDVQARILNGEIWFRIDTAVSRTVYGITASVPETDYVLVRRGKMHLLAFVGPKDAPESADPETVAAGAKLP